MRPTIGRELLTDGGTVIRDLFDGDAMARIDKLYALPTRASFRNPWARAMSFSSMTTPTLIPESAP